MLTAYGESCKQKEHCSGATVPVMGTVASGVTGTVIHFGMVINDGAPESSVYERHSLNAIRNRRCVVTFRCSLAHAHIDVASGTR